MKILGFDFIVKWQWNKDLYSTFIAWTRLIYLSQVPSASAGSFHMYIEYGFSEDLSFLEVALAAICKTISKVWTVMFWETVKTLVCPSELFLLRRKCLETFYSLLGNFEPKNIRFFALGIDASTKWPIFGTASNKTLAMFDDWNHRFKQHFKSVHCLLRILTPHVNLMTKKNRCSFINNRTLASRNRLQRELGLWNM